MTLYSNILVILVIVEKIGQHWSSRRKKKKNQYEYFHTNDDDNDAYDNDDDADDLDMVLASVKAGGNAHKHRMS